MPVSPLAKLLGLHTFVCCHVLPCQAATNMAHLRRCLLACLPPLFREAKMQREQQQRRLQWQQRRSGKALLCLGLSRLRRCWYL